MGLIILTGFMGAGKTTAGIELGEKLNLPVYDTDLLLEEKYRMAVKEMFAAYGEEKFRELETEMLQHLSEAPVIVTTGGGAVLKEENRQILKSKGQIFFLHCEFDVLYDRLKEDTARPLLKEKSKEQIKELYESRMSCYLDGSIKINATGKAPEDIADDIISRL